MWDSTEYKQYIMYGHPKIRSLVTGGAGFVGSHLVDRLLADGHEVTVLDDLSTGRLSNLEGVMDRIVFIEGSVQSFDKQLSFDRIYHLACPASPPHYQADAIRTVETCVMGTIRMCELARHQKGCRILLASTSEVYGDPQEHPQSESYWGHVNPCGLRSCYDEGKRCAECLIMNYHWQHGVDTRIARIFNTYGPRMREDDGRVVSNFIVQAKNGNPFTIYGTGEQTRSFQFISDLIEGLVRLMETPAIHEPVNLGNPHEFPIMGFAYLIGELMNLGEVRYQILPMPSDDPQRRRPDISRAKELLGWEPKIEFKEGLHQTIQFFCQ